MSKVGRSERTRLESARTEHFFRGLRLPLALPGCKGKGGELLREDDLEVLARNNESGANGLFPIGLYQTWHNGIHLWSARGTPVHALCDGTIVAACLGERSRERNVFGSRGFVLVRHTITCPQPQEEKLWRKPKRLENLTFFALYQHLEGLSGTDELAPWLLHLRPYLLQGKPADGTYVKLNGTTAARKGGKRTIAELRSEPQPYRRGKSEEWAAGKTTLFRAPSGSVAHAREETKGPFRLVRVLGVGNGDPKEGWVSFTSATVQEIPGMASQIQKLVAGGVTPLEIPVFAGEVLGWAGHIQPEHDELRAGSAPSSGIHLEIFGDEAFAKTTADAFTWLADDTDKDVMAELGPTLEKLKDADLVAMLKKLAFDCVEGKLATSPPTRAQFLSEVSASTKAKLRRLATKNTSYWAIDWEAVAARSPAWQQRYRLTQMEMKDANRYSWWRQLLPQAKALGLPPNAVAHHVHPIGFMKHILQRQMPHPVFYAEVGERVRAVHGVDVSDAPWKGGIEVWVHDPGPEGSEDWCLGKVLRYGKRLGLAGNDPPDLYDMLIDGKSVEVKLPAEVKRIWASLWNVEGGLEAVNTYDNQFITFGPFQHAGGTGGDPGELAGVLSLVKEQHPELFHELFIARGLDVKRAGGGEMKTGHFIFDGQKLTSPAAKEALRAFYPAYLLRMAMEHDVFRNSFMAQGLRRLDVIRGWSATLETENQPIVTVHLAEAYRSELGQALILDAHINRPNVARRWSVAVERAWNRTVPLTEFSSEDERLLVNRFIFERLTSSLNDPFRRTALVLACTTGIDRAYRDELAADLFDAEKNAPEELKEDLDKAIKLRDSLAEGLNTGTKAKQAKARTDFQKACKAVVALEGRKPYAQRLSDTHPLWPELAAQLDEAIEQLARKRRTPFLTRDRPSTTRDAPPK